MVENSGIYKIKITDMGSAGEGIGHLEGMAVFVPETIIGDEASVEILQVKKSYARGRLMFLETPSPLRVEPACPYMDVCGGCGLGRMNYGAQLEWKRKSVADKLTRLGRINAPEVQPVIPGKTRTGYRNKAVYAIGKDGSVGFHSRGSDRIFDCEACLLQSPAANAAASALRTFLTEHRVSVYNPSTGKGLLRNFVVRTSEETGEVMAVLVLNGKSFPGVEELAQMIYDEVENCNCPRESDFCDGANRSDASNSAWSLQYTLVSFIINVNRERKKELFGSENIVLYGQPSIKMQLTLPKTVSGSEMSVQNGTGDIMTYEISPVSFYQVNSRQTEKLYGLAAEFAGLTGKETVFDLYCGVGTIGLSMASKAGYIWGIEIVKNAVVDANRNATINGIVNARFVAGKSEEEMPVLMAEGKQPEVIIMDPPRAGCHPALLEAVLKAAPAKILYISCDPATLARDLKILTLGGYSLDRVQPVDMFPETTSIEVCSLLTRRVPGDI